MLVNKDVQIRDLHSLMQCINTIHLLLSRCPNTRFQEFDASLTRPQKVKVVAGGLARDWKNSMRLPPCWSKKIENFAALHLTANCTRCSRI